MSPPGGRAVTTATPSPSPDVQVLGGKTGGGPSAGGKVPPSSGGTGVLGTGGGLASTGLELPLAGVVAVGAGLVAGGAVLRQRAQAAAPADQTVGDDTGEVPA